ncbi:MAG: ATP-binding protein [Deltaproteobacteria bacterium]|nr:ATP-binding protein [Deltaproteobacteria bacterium]
MHLLFGARQTGKSTLLRALVPHAHLWLDLAEPGARSRYLTRPETFVEECAALPASARRPARVVVDEAQAVPAIFDAVQHLYDSGGGRYRFVLSGSSARKLRAAGANLLPGRSMVHRLFPLTLAERPPPLDTTSPRGTLLPGFGRGEVRDPFPTADLVERLAYGELPVAVVAKERDRAALLHAYAYVYLEEELRREALIRDWPAFARFLRLAALESGTIVNYAAIAQEAGLSAPSVKSHYQLLEDMFVGFHVGAFTGSARKHVLSTPRFLFFDVGVRNAAAELPIGRATVIANAGPLFEQWVGIELWKRLQYLGGGRLSYLRTKAGAEVDWIVEHGGRVVPIEVKWTERPSLGDARHLRVLLDELGAHAPMGYLICRCERPRLLAPKVTALPWWAL